MTKDKPVWIRPDDLQKAQRAPFLCRVEPNKRDDFVPLYTAPPVQEPVAWMDVDEALDLALEALEDAHHTVEHKQDAVGRIKAITAIKQARALDKKAENARELGLDYEPVQEPVAWRVKWPAIGGGHKWIMADKPLMEKEGFVNQALYTTPPAQPAPVQLTDEQAEFESVFKLPSNCTKFQGGYAPTSYNAWEAQTFCARWEGWKARSVTPPNVATPLAAQRQWVSLTEDEVTICHSLAVLSKKHDGTDPSFTTLLHQQIEAKLKEKNT